MIRIRIATLATFLAAALLLAHPAAAAPCTDATPACSDWVALNGGPARSLVYRTYPLTTPNDRITRAFVMVHGAGRDADNYFRHALAAGFLADALDDTIIIAPRFASNDGRGCRDMLAENEINWPCGGDSWRSGGASPQNAALTSFAFMDAILRALANRQTFPNLKAIVVGGHSAGGQFVTRYEMANQIHDTLGVPVTYIVANPSSYAYLDTLRPSNGDNGAVDFRAFGDARNCTTYDNWPYGLEKRTGYTAKMSDEQLKAQLAARPTTYLVGELDTLPLAGFDSSCPAMAQGPTRRTRGEDWDKYVNGKFGAHHAIMVVPLCGHNARCMFTADAVLPLIFPKP